MSEKLKPCAHCGHDGAERITWDDARATGFIRHAIDCPRGAGGCGMRTQWYKTATEAVLAWDRRAPQEPSEDVEALTPVTDPRFESNAIGTVVYDAIWDALAPEVGQGTAEQDRRVWAATDKILAALRSAPQEPSGDFAEVSIDFDARTATTRMVPPADTAGETGGHHGIELWGWRRYGKGEWRYGFLPIDAALQGWELEHETVGPFRLAAPPADTARKVGCEDSEGLLHIHPESETCEVCSPPGHTGEGE